MNLISLDTENILFQLAADLVSQSTRNIFLTGKAGTGKTTFLKYIRQHCLKNMAIVAPTGVASINAGGVTIHSFFQLPFTPFTPSGKIKDGEAAADRTTLLGRLRFNKEKLSLLRQLELLVIDEVSMVRCDVLDAIDIVLKHARKNNFAPFGGVQLLLIGDMYQLPPVTKETDWQILSRCYESPYFFNSLIFKDAKPLYIEFERIYRQKDEQFVFLLNQIRNNALDEQGLRILESRFLPAFRYEKDQGYVILSTHNESARKMNQNELDKLLTQSITFTARIENDFPENAYPTDFELSIKVGAQVMFIRNESTDKGRRYYNGKIGTVTKLDEDHVYIKCKEDENEIEVLREKWENIRYTTNKKSGQIEEELLGTFSQFPIKLAWAITIHKSQGLTFDKAIIDAGSAFAPGQVYVALSRCTNLEGLILKTRISRGSLQADPRVSEFSKSVASSAFLQKQLLQAKDEYWNRLISQLYSLEEIIQQAGDLKKYIIENRKSFGEQSVPWVERLEEILKKGKEFHIKEHFEQQLIEVSDFLKKSEVRTDSWQHAREFNDSIKELYGSIAEKMHMILAAKTPDILLWQAHKKRFELPSININAYAVSQKADKNTNHPALFKELKNLRDAICIQRKLPVYLVASSHSLEEMVEFLPQTATDLKMITGFGDVKVRQFGKDFLEIIIAYCNENQLSSKISEKKIKKVRPAVTNSGSNRTDTYYETYILFKKGLSIAEISKERKLTKGTIETHLAKYVRSGDISIHELLVKDKIELIEHALKNYTSGSITAIKELLDESISYGEIRLVMAAIGLEYKPSN